MQENAVAMTHAYGPNPRMVTLSISKKFSGALRMLWLALTGTLTDADARYREGKHDGDQITLAG